MVGPVNATGVGAGDEVQLAPDGDEHPTAAGGRKLRHGGVTVAVHVVAPHIARREVLRPAARRGADISAREVDVAIDDGRPGGFYVPRFRNISDKNPNFIRAYGFEGSAGSQMFPGNANDTPGFGAGYKKTVRDYSGAFISMGGFGEVLARYENQVLLDPAVKDKWGIPVLRFNYKFGENEKKMCEDMAVAAQEMFELAGFEILNVDRAVLTEGWSIHELGTARMGTDKKTSVLNQFQQSHDVKNLFVVDGSSHVNASCQNPTWTIMALAWRSCDYLATELSKGNL